MTKKLRFFKQNKKWYADVPYHTLEENEMVMGADMALELIADGKNEVYITVSDNSEEYMLAFTLKDHDGMGGYYTVSGELFDLYAEECAGEGVCIPDEIWLCNVTHDVFGEHPMEFYVEAIEF